MKNKLWVKILYILTLIIQVGIVIGTFVVEYFTKQYKYSKEYFDYFHSYIFNFSYYGIKK